MILCLNLNAAIDKTVVVSSFEINKIHRPESVLSLAGGKGCNVARALKTLQLTPVVSGWVGGLAGQFIEQALQQEGLQSDFVHTGCESRTCLSILDREHQTTTEIYEHGEPIPPEKIDELLERIQTGIRRYEAITLSGSLPPGVPLDFYARVIEIAKQANVLTFLDTSSEALHLGLASGPFLVKPNEAEAKSLLGLKSDEPLDSVQTALEISSKYKTGVVLSLGANGAVAASNNRAFKVKSPRVEAKSAVGCGDCMLAGLVFGVLQGLSFEETVIRGIAAGTANTLTFGAGRFRLEDFERYCNQLQAPQ